MSEQFRYFPGFPNGAGITSDPCYFCGRRPALDGIWLDFDQDFDELPPVCVDDLLADRAHVAIPGWVQTQLRDHLDQSHPEWTTTEKEEYVRSRTYELAHTPPVPWIQENEWPACSDDYAVFEAELTRERLDQESGGVEEGILALQTIMQTERPDWHIDAAAARTWWQQLGGFLRIYRFRCSHGQHLHVVQTM